ncbi:MAG: sulfatase-like hydrolase/transferase [Treponema sp.]|nr:sulfatase-like hydrolase/transferase [Treponema sp.]
MKQPNILYLMADQWRFDCIAALGNKKISTPNIDRLVSRGVAFTNAYSNCPVCVAARYTIRTGRDTNLTGSFTNAKPAALDGLAQNMEDRCGPYLARFMGGLGYRTFGMGKFHTVPDWNEDVGFETMLHAEASYRNTEQRSLDAYGGFIMREHPEYAHVEQPHGDRTEMYYMPQTSPLPARLNQEAFVADKIIELINNGGSRPWFGFVSFFGPHPPFAPPVPFNRMYNPDRLDNPVCGQLAVDHMDEQIPWMNHDIWADEINDYLTRVLKSRYYGEISYIDNCIGRILDAVEKTDACDNTLICFFTDHGDHLGDHHAWQKESFFEQSAHIPFLLSWPSRLPAGTLNNELVGLTDLFAIASSAAGAMETRDGMDVLGMLEKKAAPRDYFFGTYGMPGTPEFKFMIRRGDYKYIFLPNGNRRQLFDLRSDPNELRNLACELPAVSAEMHNLAKNHGRRPGWLAAFEGDDFKVFPYTERPHKRVNQMAHDRGIHGFSFLP